MSKITSRREVVAKGGLQVGQELSAERIEALARSDYVRRGLKTAGRYLSYRPHSESELREKLYQRGFDAEIREAVIMRLKEQGLVDDVAFAQFWRENRDSFSPRSQQLIRLELGQKGVAQDIIGKVVIDDEDSAYRAALNRAHRLSRSDYQSFRQRLGAYLKQRGFNDEVINHTVARLWRERRVEA